MSQILGFEGGVLIWQRQGSKMLFGSGVPPELERTTLPMYATSIQVYDFDVTGKVICLNDKRILYEFGKGFGTIILQGDILLGNLAVQRGGTEFAGKGFSASGETFSALIKYFNEKRVSAPGGKKPLVITCGGQQSPVGGKFEFYLSQFNLGPIVPETGVVQFQLTGDLVRMSQ